jgi:hypothetical protein
MGQPLGWVHRYAIMNVRNGALPNATDAVIVIAMPIARGAAKAFVPEPPSAAEGMIDALRRPSRSAACTQGRLG